MPSTQHTFNPFMTTFITIQDNFGHGNEGGTQRGHNCGGHWDMDGQGVWHGGWTMKPFKWRAASQDLIVSLHFYTLFPLNSSLSSDFKIHADVSLLQLFAVVTVFNVVNYRPKMLCRMEKCQSGVWWFTRVKLLVEGGMKSTRRKTWGNCFI